jgi:peptidoglycan/LPS O-acetylase OafA/YrhL
MTIEYRPEIDGLRTIAVLSVIIYHAEFPMTDGQLLPGGFLGVDVFFVISGFLITSLLLSEYCSNGTLSISSFYERRARRLLPAMLVVMLASLPFAWIYLAPLQLIDFAKSLIASLVFASNFYWNFSLQQYGAESALLKPFLHTWSLAVEEQYYIVFPLLLLGIQRRFEHRRSVLLLIGLLLSLVIAEWSSSRNPSFSFYMLPSRFWELLAGGLLASILHDIPRPTCSSTIGRIMPLFGLLLIIYSLVNTKLGTGHPGFVTITPVAGTVLILWFAHRGELLTRLLASGPFVKIGLISYSLYLWHYPIFSFGRIFNHHPTNIDKLGWIILTFLLSTITYFLVEKPFRKSTTVSRRALLTMLLALIAVVGAISAGWIKGNGIPSRLGYLRTVLELAKVVRLEQKGAACHSGGYGGKPTFDLAGSCVFEYHPGASFLVLLGDSHAGVLSNSVRALAEANDLNYLQITDAGCLHITGLQAGLCEERSAGLAVFLEQYPVASIIYSARIPLRLELERFDNKEGDREDRFKPVDEEKVLKTRRVYSARIEQEMTSWAKLGYPLVIVYPVPEQGFHLSLKLFSQRPIITSKEQLPALSTSYAIFNKRVSSSYNTLDRVRGESVSRVYPEYLFCSAQSQRCFASQGERLYFASDNHVSPLGAEMIVTEVARTLELQVPADFRK